MPLPAIAAALSGPVIATLLRTAGLWLLQGLVKIMGNWLLLLIATMALEFLPRLLGLGQGLIGWMWSAGAVGLWNGFSKALDLVGLDLPNFEQLLKTLPSTWLSVAYMMRIHKVAYILVSIPIFNLSFAVFKKLASVVAAAGSGAASTMAHGAK